MKYICSLLTVSDIQRSRDFYENILGQNVKSDFGENVSFVGDFAIHLRSHFYELIDKKEIETGTNNVELYFEDDNLEKITEILNENNVEFLHEIREQPWRQKVMRFYDPDKYLIEIGESMEHLAFRLSQEGMTVEEIAGITYLPVDYIKHSIESYSKIK